jgi:hypothetical protein
MSTSRLTFLCLWAAGTILGFAHAASDATPPQPMGPLRVCAANPRYFADPSGRPVYLTGSHTWQSLQDGVLSNCTAVSQPVDYPGYRKLLQTNDHNLIRLWRPVAGGSQRSLKAPFSGDAVLYLRQRQEQESTR